jgi:hypothetical protein
VPLAPTIGSPQVLSDTSIRLNFSYNATDTTGFRLYNSSGNLVSQGTGSISSLDETGLSCGTFYLNRYVTAYNSYGEGAASAYSSSISTNGCPAASGGMPSSWYSPPQTPIGGFGLSINSGNKTATNANVILNLKAGTDTSRMAISNAADFIGAGQENYAPSKAWNLCWKNSILQTPSTCPSGTYTVYAKYYTPWGTASNVVSDSIVLKTGANITSSNQISNQTANQISLNQPFTKDLRFGNINTDVKRLQIFLNQDPTTQIAKTGIGSSGKETNIFGYLTKAAVIKFQEKYASDILTPNGFKKGTGIVSKYTRAKINKLLGF